MKKINFSKSFKFAFMKTIPILFSYVFIGMAFGLLMQNAGYNFLWSYFASAGIFTGAYQFFLVPSLVAGTSLLTMALTALLMNSRHMFYGISLVDKFKKTGKFYPYMIYTLTDENYSLYITMNCPKDVEESKTMVWIAFLCRIYWIGGSVLGALVGQLLPFKMEGIDFCMTAFFVTIFMDQWKSAKSHLPSVIGLCSGILFLILLGADNFILPALAVTVVLLILLKKPIDKKENVEVSLE